MSGKAIQTVSRGGDRGHHHQDQGHGQPGVVSHSCDRVGTTPFYYSTLLNRDRTTGMGGEGNRGDVTARILFTHKTRRSPRRWRTPLSLFILFLIRPTSTNPLTPLAPVLVPTMACPFDQLEATDLHLTPPLSPSVSSGSSRESSAPSFSTSTSSHHLPRDIEGLHSTYPDSQPLVGCMPDGLGDDTVMLDASEWEREGKREERDHVPQKGCM
ncbi:hypothetical protein F5888DRAFT_1180024 [Russula emetica]|nr:hypothetical protein F5888DRAFT_1180024 [Russula emetica]